MIGASADIILTSSSAFLIFLILANVVDAVAAAVADGCAGRQVVVVRAELEVKDDQQNVRIDLLTPTGHGLVYPFTTRELKDLARYGAFSRCISHQGHPGFG
ncbi:hypothetical protein Hdeb2414_s0093g00789831 [Helianthus debilis subsp. tardiflorus]